MSRDTSRSGEFPPSRHKDRGSVGPRWSGVFRVKVREARTMHIVRRTLMGVSAVGLATLLSVGAMTSFAVPAGAATVAPQIPQFAAAQAAAKWLVTQQAANGSIGGSLSSTANGILALAAADDTAAAQSALSYMEANADSFITVAGGGGTRRSGSVGPPDSGRTRNERRSRRISAGRTSRRGCWPPSRRQVLTPGSSGQRRS